MMSNGGVCPICDGPTSVAGAVTWRQTNRSVDLCHCAACDFYRVENIGDDAEFSTYHDASSAPPLHSDRFDRTHLRNHSRLSLLQTFHDITPGDHILEIGPGHDGILRELCRGRYPNNYLAFEPCIADAAVLESMGAQVVTDTFGPNPSISPGSINIAVANQVLYYLPDPLQVLNTIFQAMAPGAVLLAEVANRSPGFPADLSSTIHRSFFSVTSFTLLLERAGFSLRFINTCGATFEEMGPGHYPADPNDTGFFSPGFNRRLNRLHQFGLSLLKCHSPTLALARNPESPFENVRGG